MESNKKEHLDPRDYGLSKNELRHLKVLDLLDQDSVKSLNSLKDDLKLTSLHYVSHIRLERVILRLMTINPDLKLSSNGVKTLLTNRENLHSITSPMSSRKGPTTTTNTGPTKA